MTQKIKLAFQKIKGKGAIEVVLGSFLTKFVTFFGSIFLVRMLSKSDYGVLSYYENIASYFILLAGFGLAGGLQRYIVLQPTLEEKHGCYNYALKRGSFLNCFILIACFLFSFIYPHPEAFKGYTFVFFALTACIPVVFIWNSSLSTFRGLFENRAYAIIAFVGVLLQVPARVLGAYFFDLNGTVIARFLSELICAVAAVLILKRRFFANAVPKEIENAGEFNSYSFQMMLTDGLWAIFMLNDMFLLGRFGASEIALAEYKVAYVIPANLSILVSAIGVFVAPYFTKRDAEGNSEWVKRKTLLVLAITFAVMLVATGLCAVLANPLIKLLYGAQYLSAVPVMRVLLIASLCNNGIRATIANVLSSIGLQKYNLYVAAIGIILQVTVNTYMIPTYGSIGLAWTSALVYLVMSICLCVFFFYNNVKIKE